MKPPPTGKLLLSKSAMEAAANAAERPKRRRFETSSPFEPRNAKRTRVEVSTAHSFAAEAYCSTHDRLGIPEHTQFHVLSFEGPDPYSRIGGLETRVSGLCQ